MVDFISTMAADNMRLARSKNLVSLADGTYNVMQLPRYAFVRHVWLLVTTAYAGGDGTAQVGFTGNKETADTDAFLNAARCAATVTGMKRSLVGYGVAAEGKWFNDGSGQITVTLAANGATTAMIGMAFVDYTVLH